jgi:hypothetical protein
MGPGHHATFYISISSFGLQAVKTNHIDEELSNIEQELFFLLLNRFIRLCLQFFKYVLGLLEELA